MTDTEILNIRDRVLECLDEGHIDDHSFIMCCLKWMSTRDIAEMLRANEINLEPDIGEEFVQ